MDPTVSDLSDANFVPETVHKRDVFSETISGHLEGVEDFPVALRRLDRVPRFAKPLAWWLARREIRGLEAVQGIEGCPVLVRVDRTGLLRSWTTGTPLQLATSQGHEEVVALLQKFDKERNQPSTTEENV